MNMIATCQKIVCDVALCSVIVNVTVKMTKPGFATRLMVGAVLHLHIGMQQQVMNLIATCQKIVCDVALCSVIVNVTVKTTKPGFATRLMVGVVLHLHIGMQQQVMNMIATCQKIVCDVALCSVIVNVTVKMTKP